MSRTRMFLYVIRLCNVLLLDGGSLPLCAAVLMVDVVGSAEVVLPLLPARGQHGQLGRLARPAHILTLQELPTGLWNKTKQKNTSQWITLRSTQETRTKTAGHIWDVYQNKNRLNAHQYSSGFAHKLSTMHCAQRFPAIRTFIRTKLFNITQTEKKA